MGDLALARLLASRGIHDSRVLEAVARLDRREFVPAWLEGSATEDRPLPIGEGQTISQPYIVAFMTEALRLRGDERVLEIGTGSGYQAAVLAQLCRVVYSIEVLPELARTAAQRLARFPNVHLRVGDGWGGWPDAAPFDAIVLTAAPDQIPEPLLSQLAPGGRLVAPVGPVDDTQRLVRVTRPAGDGTFETEELLEVRFVPLVHGPSRP